MSTTTAQTFAAAPKVVTVKDLLKKLNGYAQCREIALKAYTNYSNSEKIIAIHEIYRELWQAEKCISDLEAAKHLLRTALNFHFIAPTASRKEYTGWYNKIEDVMNACRLYLGRGRQA